MIFLQIVSVTLSNSNLLTYRHEHAKSTVIERLEMAREGDFKKTLAQNCSQTFLFFLAR